MMSSSDKFSDDAQSDLLSAAAQLYEAEMYELCMGVLHVLLRCGNREAYILAGHCIASSYDPEGINLANKYYEIACEMGSATGCYNLYLNHLNKNNEVADEYLQKAMNLGWKI